MSIVYEKDVYIEGLQKHIHVFKMPLMILRGNVPQFM